MPANLSFRPRRKRGRPVLLLVILLLGGGWLAWRQGWLPAPVTALIEQNLDRYAPAAVSGPPGPSQPASTWPPAPPPQPAAEVQVQTVALVESNVIEPPHSTAHTAALHQEAGQKDPIPWPNAAGRTEVITYVVQSGDTLWSVANKFELDLDTLRWSNLELERNPDVLLVGTELIILPVNGAYHLIQEEDTVESIAERYGVSEAAITDYPPNGMYPPHDLEAGTGLIVPFGRKDRALPKPSVSADYPLAWPMVSAVIGAFSPDHPAIDIGAPYGATVYAAHGGVVIAADWSENYGYRVILEHGDGLQTWYAHMKGTPLRVSMAVPRGTPVGQVGSTGRSSGPHLHFEVRIDDTPVDPLDYLAPEPQ